MNDWFDFKKSFTQKQEDALWQYFIDHSNIESNGFYKIHFHVRDMDDFWRRVYARYTGEFTRYDKLEKQHQNEMISVHIFKKRADKIGRVCERIDKRGSFFEKILLFIYRKSRDKLF